MEEGSSNLKGKVKIVKGSVRDASHFPNLMEFSGPTLFLTVFGNEFKTILESLFRRRRNLFSFEHTYMAKIDDEIAGMVLGYDWKTKKKEEINTGRLIIKHMGFEFIRRLPLLLKLNSIVGHLKEGEFYISNIAVYPKYRGRSIGTLLLNFVEENVRLERVEKLVLDVETKNIGAIKLYRRVGFNISGRFSTRLKREIFEFFRMEKFLL